MRSTILMALIGMAGAMLVACGSGTDQGSAPGADENDLAVASLENRNAALLAAGPVTPQLSRTGHAKSRGRVHFGARHVLR